MTPSALYTNLELRINQLQGRFLSFNNPDSLLSENQDRLMSFRLLVHAEIEHYIEEFAKSIITKYLNEWTRNSVILPGLKYLFVYSPKKYDGDTFLTINDRVNICCQSFKSRIDNNNGIKQKNIISLFVPLGLLQSHIDNTWLATMDSFGSRRGSYAHKSFSVQRPIDKATEMNDLTKVLSGLKTLDSEMQKVTSKNFKKPF